jgi:indole-3-glycerol phosphate synthase
VNSLLQKIVARKREEIAAAKAAVPLAELEVKAATQPAARDFVRGLCGGTRIGLIAEVKKASPSKGVIREDFDPVQIARIYQQHGANCISVLTDEDFFQGKLDYLRAIRRAVTCPLLRKDFILDEYQVVEARAAGADAVLLIAECLEAERLVQLHQAIEEWGMTALVELYDPRNIENVLRCQPRLIGVNNRNLNTFEVDLEQTLRVRRKLPAEIAVVSESGIETHEQVQRLSEQGIQGILVGETLMRAPEIGAAVEKLMGISGTRNQEPGTRNQEPGTRNQGMGRKG